MRAGVAKIDITPNPPVGAFMTGYTSKPDMPATGIHDPLWARALILDDGQTAIALVALDLVKVVEAVDILDYLINLGNGQIH